MKSEDVHIDDLRRILIGEVPGEFYIELVIRSLVVYMLLVAGMRLMGKRVNAELNRSELGAISTLAASTGLVLLSPDRGLLPAIVAITVLVVIKRTVNIRAYKSNKFEKAAEGSLGILVSNGVLQMEELKNTGLSREQLFAQLRSAELIHLGLIERFYFEANGSFSLVKATDEKPGLPVIPEWDNAFIDEQQKTDVKVCGDCGHTQETNEIKCSNCGHTDNWKMAILEPAEQE